MLKSIKFKIVVLVLAAFSITFAGLEFSLYYELEEFAIGFIDDHLSSEANILSSLLKVEEEHGQLETELAEISQTGGGEYAERFSGHYYQVINERGDILARSPSLGDTSLPVALPSIEPVFYNIRGPVGEPLRVMSQSFEYQVGLLTIQAADTLEDTYKLLGMFRRVALIVYPVVFFISVLGVYIISGWALRSLKVFSSKISQVTEENLTERVETDVSELAPLAASFNTMLGRLSASFERRKQFLSDASHELRTPTSIIKSYCDVTLGRERTPEAYREALTKIGETVNRMCDIINRILVVSRLESKAIEFKPVRIDLKDIVKDIARLMESPARSKGVSVSVSGLGVNIRGDKEGITEVLTNLIENAVKYNKPGGSVEVTTGAENNMATVTIKDTGIGIPREDLDKVFERFYRVDASRGVTVGSGLGLSIVRSIVEAHGGRVTVESEAGKGSTFRVFLPREA